MFGFVYHNYVCANLVHVNLFFINWYIWICILQLHVLQYQINCDFCPPEVDFCPGLDKNLFSLEISVHAEDTSTP